MLGMEGIAYGLLYGAHQAQRRGPYPLHAAAVMQGDMDALANAYAKSSQRNLEAEAKWEFERMMARIRDKDRNMNTRLERRRKAINDKWRARAKVAAIVMVAAPISVAVVSGLWRVALWTVLA